MHTLFRVVVLQLSVIMLSLKRFLFVAIFILAVCPMKGQKSVSYTYKPFAAEGCSVWYTPTIVNDTAYVVVNVRSDRLVFSERPTMMVRFFGSDDVLQLNGINLNTTTTHSVALVNNVVMQSSGYIAMAMFMVTEEQMAMFENGVSKIRVTTIPIVHERTFKKDKIGAKIYQNYQKVKAKNQTF